MARMSFIKYLALMSAVSALPIPQGGMDQIMGPAQTGIFGSGAATSPPSINLSGLAGLGGVVGMGQDTTGGSGPYKSHYGAIEGLPGHTLYQPKEPPAGEKLPVIVWGNGACSGNGVWFAKFLNEIASHGFFIIANGSPSGSNIFSQTKGTDMPDAIDWITKNGGEGKYAHVDKTKIAAAGQSCGGIQAYSASLDPRVSLTGIFNSGLINAGNTPKFEGLHGPVGYFLGGPSDIAYENGVRDYKNLPKKIKSVLASLPVGHMATYGDAHGGQFGKAAVAFFKWQMKGDKEAGQMFLNPASGPFVKAGWTIESKGWN